jgi:PAS domain S-box-containing protein
MRTDLKRILGLLAATGNMMAGTSGANNSVLNDAMLGICAIFTALTTLFLVLYYLGQRGKNKAEAALKESELRALHILNGARDAIISVNEDGYVQSFNPAAVMMFGCPAQEAVGQSILSFLGPGAAFIQARKSSSRGIFRPRPDRVASRWIVVSCRSGDERSKRSNQTYFQHFCARCFHAQEHGDRT